jgi:hypothetical protein
MRTIQFLLVIQDAPDFNSKLKTKNSKLFFW